MPMSGHLMKGIFYFTHRTTSNVRRNSPIARGASLGADCVNIYQQWLPTKRKLTTVEVVVAVVVVVLAAAAAAAVVVVVVAVVVVS